MKLKKHGGPAFPFNYINETREPQESFATDRMIPVCAAEQYGGLSVRDYFAAKAMQSYITGYFQWCLADGHNEMFDGVEVDPQRISVAAYDMADAMLEAGGHTNE